jgi:hypothetical protein
MAVVVSELRCPFLTTCLTPCSTPLCTRGHLDCWPLNCCKCSSCVQKVAFEAPPGVKRNIQRSLSTVATAAAAGASPSQLQLQALLAWFHAVIQVCHLYDDLYPCWSKFQIFNFKSFAFWRCSARTHSDSDVMHSIASFPTCHGLPVHRVKSVMTRGSAVAARE